MESFVRPEILNAQILKRGQKYHGPHPPINPVDEQRLKHRQVIEVYAHKPGDRPRKAGRKIMWKNDIFVFYLFKKDHVVWFCMGLWALNMRIYIYIIIVYMYNIIIYNYIWLYICIVYAAFLLGEWSCFQWFQGAQPIKPWIPLSLFSHQTIHTDVSYCSRRCKCQEYELFTHLQGTIKFSSCSLSSWNWITMSSGFEDKEVLQCPALTNLNQSLLNQPGLVPPKSDPNRSPKIGDLAQISRNEGGVWRGGVAILDGHCMTFTWMEVASKLEA